MSCLPMAQQPKKLLEQQKQQQGERKSIMVLNTEWTQLETIELLCEAPSGLSSSTTAGSTVRTVSGSAGTVGTATADGDKNRINVPGGLSASPSTSGLSGGGGFGFGITGNKSTGVVVKALTPGGYAQRVSS